MELRSNWGPVEVWAVTPASPDQEVFNLEVSLEHTYRVSADRIWAHNNSPNPARITPGSLPASEEAALLDTVGHIDARTVPEGPTSIKWGTQFENREGRLPGASGIASPYQEYRVAPPPGTVGGGLRRVVVDKGSGDMFYTWTHYGTTGETPAFVRIR